MVQVAVSAAAGPGGGGGPLAARHRNRQHAFISRIKSIVVPIGCIILLCVIYMRFNRLVFGDVVVGARSSSSSKTKTTTTATAIPVTSAQSNTDNNNDSLTPSTSNEGGILLNPEKMMMNDVLLHYQFPPLSTSPAIASSSNVINGVVLLFHGCNHDSIDWFQLPEEQAIVRYLLSMGNIVVAISSYKSYKNQGSKCWDTTCPPSDNQDVHLISSILQPSSSSSATTTTKKPVPLLEKIRERLTSETTSVDSIFSSSSSSSSLINGRPVPIYGIGASSGGTFVTILHQIIPMNGIEVMISPGHPDAIDWIAATKSSSLPLRIAFVYMPKDTRFASEEAINNAQKVLSSSSSSSTTNNNNNNIIQTRSYKCLPKPISAKFLSRIDNLSLQHARVIVDILEKNHIVDTKSSMLVVNPRRYWKKIIQKLSEIDILKTSVVSNPVIMASLEESLNLADGTHELTSEHIQNVYEFWTT